MIIFPDISPEIFSISVFGLSFSVRWYALSYIVGILLAWRMALVALRRCRALAQKPCANGRSGF